MTHTPKCKLSVLKQCCSEQGHSSIDLEPDRFGTLLQNLRYGNGKTCSGSSLERKELEILPKRIRR